MLESAKAILTLAGGGRVVLEPCTITSVTPLEVSLNGATVAGVKVAGLVYTTGPGVVLWSPPSAPIVLPVD